MNTTDWMTLDIYNMNGAACPYCGRPSVILSSSDLKFEFSIPSRSGDSMQTYCASCNIPLLIEARGIGNFSPQSAHDIDLSPNLIEMRFSYDVEDALERAPTAEIQPQRNEPQPHNNEIQRQHSTRHHVTDDQNFTTFARFGIEKQSPAPRIKTEYHWKSSKSKSPKKGGLFSKQNSPKKGGLFSKQNSPKRKGGGLFSKQNSLQKSNLRYKSLKYISLYDNIFS